MRTHLILLAVFLQAPLRSEGFQGWYQLTAWHRLDERWNVGGFLFLRDDDAVGRMGGWTVSPRIRYDLSPVWQLQFNLSVLESVNTDETDRQQWLRPEFEANPTLPLGGALTLNVRNRLEFRFRDGHENTGVRLRIRPQLEWDCGPGLLKNFFVSEEVIHDFDADSLTENRLTPLGVTLRASASTEVRLYYMWRHALGHDQWRDYHVAGVATSLSF